MHTDQQAIDVLNKLVSKMPERMAVLGSGWQHALDGAVKEIEIPFSEWLGVEASVPGHEGKLIIASIGETRVAVMSGRIHTYEGYSSYEVTTPIRALQQAGVKEVLVTAACGALHPKFAVGEFVVLTDLITLFLALDNPIRGSQFVDLSQIFDVDLQNRARQVMTSQNIQYQLGNYCYYHGPNYETPADKMALRILGADVVGMSTVPESLVARSLDMKILGLGFVTNLAFVKHDHHQVVAVAEASGQQMKNFLTAYYS